MGGVKSGCGAADLHWMLPLLAAASCRDIPAMLQCTLGFVLTFYALQWILTGQVAHRGKWQREATVFCRREDDPLIYWWLVSFALLVGISLLVDFFKSLPPRLQEGQTASMTSAQADGFR